MANGFMQRWNGKVLAKQFWLAGSKVTASAADLNTLGGAATVTNATTAAAIAAGIAKIPAAAGTYPLAAPTAGARVTLYTTDVGAGARKIQANGGAVFQSTLAGAGFLNLSTSTVDSIGLIGVSTAYWVVTFNRGAATVTTA